MLVKHHVLFAKLPVVLVVMLQHVILVKPPEVFLVTLTHSVSLMASGMVALKHVDEFDEPLQFWAAADVF